MKPARRSRELRDELLNGETFYILKEERIVIEKWRNHYNTMQTAFIAGMSADSTTGVQPLPATSR